MMLLQKIPHSSDFESEDWLYLALPDHLPVNEQKENIS